MDWAKKQLLLKKRDSGSSTDSVYSTKVVGRRKSEQYAKYEGEQQMRLIGTRLKDTMLCQHAAEKFDVQARSRKKRDK